MVIAIRMGCTEQCRVPSTVLFVAVKHHRGGYEEICLH